MNGNQCTTSCFALPDSAWPQILCRTQRLCHTLKRRRTQLRFPFDRLPAKLTNPIQTSPCCFRSCCRCYCSVTAVCRFSSADFLGAPPLLNCYCADTSVTMHATNDLSSSLPLLSFVTSFAVSTHLHDSSDSSYQRFNLMPCFPLRQVVCLILFARDSSHFYSS